MGTRQLRRMIRKILVESFSPEEMEKIKVLMTSGCSHINMVDVMMEPQEFEDLYLDMSLTKPSWASICEDFNSEGDIKVFSSGVPEIRLDANCKQYHQRNCTLHVDPKTLIIQDSSCTWWQYILYYDGDTDWEDVTPSDVYDWSQSLVGKKFTPLFACQIAEEHDALNRKHPQK